tara:strand:- start:273 stop:1088 length:816 start_codon:yes stop_codon:yes gene_type:complete
VLGLAISIPSSNVFDWSPDDHERPPTLWFRNNHGIISSEGGDGVSYSPDRSSELGNLSDEDKIKQWTGQGSTALNFRQTTAADMPRFETDAADFGSLAFPNAAKYMDLFEDGGSGSTARFSAQFTILVRCKVTDLSAARTVLGDDDEEFIRFGGGSGQLTNTIRMKINNNAVNFTNGSGNFRTDEYTNFIITRDESNLCKLFVYSSSISSNEQGTEWGGETTQAGEISISNLGSSDDDTNNFQGFISDVIVWASELSNEERELAFNYVRKV